ncbi:Glutathione amide reductase [Rubripirellula lacrimiformis]|uniref:Glutathione amide reductase n=1 Tax=Rubripirellula lacrimiformis TaxID=1930273 RepID=A0A517NCB8_9BACT|nr:NAD(P)/FAD-dependent oxidoreductase [Rubripirellula lacrimiformis]QDT04769.1 Glutathione amide reductase [Rubripirellula lacrimiformis]
MIDHSFDLIVIGTGPAAGTVAKKTAESGKSVAVVESRGFGGTCALRGCNPKKVFTNAGKLVDQAIRANGSLATFHHPQIDWGNLLAFKQQFTRPVTQKSEASFQKRGIRTFHGIARFSGPDTIRVDGVELRGERIFIATGSMPSPLQIQGSDLVTRSDAFLEMETMPSQVTFIGGGYISMEFAHVVARFGSRVVIVDSNERPLMRFDADLVGQLVDRSRQIGIEFTMQSKVTGVTRTKDGLSVSIDGSGDDQTVESQLVVHGAGRVPNIVDLDLAAGSVDFGEQGIEVDETMRSVSNPRVFAGGDCVHSGMPRLTPVANEEARIVVKNLFSETPDTAPDYGAVPAVVFTTPCLAAVGLTQAQALEQYPNVDVRYEDTSTWGSVRKTRLDCAGYKVLVDKQTDRILGAHLLGPAAEETINLFALAMKFGLTATDLKSTLFAFPTFASDVRRMV